MSDKLKTFLKRLFSTIISLAVVAAALVGTYYFENTWCCASLICLLCNLAAVEWFLMLREKKAECNRWLILIGGLVYPWLAALVYTSLSKPYSATLLVYSWLAALGYTQTQLAVLRLLIVIACLILFILAAVICELFRMDYGKQSAEAALRSVGTTVFAFVYPGWFLAFALGYMEPHYGLPILVTIVAITKLSDTWAYLCGVLVGRRFISRPFSPTVSPKKSWEGFIGSLILTTLSAVMLIRFVEPEYPMWFAIISAVVVYFISVAGDLAGSLVKRGIGVKDSSHLLPGIGGIIDLIDSPAFTIALVAALSTF